MTSIPRIALKVDCDTFAGTRNGIPALLRTFDRTHVRASFFFTLGPDRSGLAIKRVFTQKGFLKKMFRSNAASLYGPKTALYGTLLPAPLIGKNLKNAIRSVMSAGHEIGVHGWDHVRWHDQLDYMTESEIAHDYGRAHRMFEEIFGRRARASAAPGWHATATSLKIQDQYDMLYASDTRGGPPFFPHVEGTTFKLLQIPTTLPTWDEALVDPTFRDRHALIGRYNTSIQGTEVHTIHTEVEGGRYNFAFEDQLKAWSSLGFAFITMEEIARETLSDIGNVPVKEIARVSILHRGGLVSA